MSQIKILDERKYPLNIDRKDELPYYRWEHRVTLGRKGKTYMVFVDNGIMVNNITLVPPTSYIEDISSGNLEAIKDDLLWEELKVFAETRCFLEIQQPLSKER